MSRFDLFKASLFIFVAVGLRAAPIRAQTVSTLGEQFDGSGDVEVAPDGSVWIGNFGQAVSATGINGQEVLRMQLDGQLSMVATGFQGASGNAFGPDGSFYQSDIRNSRVVRVLPNGQMEALTGDNLMAPIGIAITPDGMLYVNECNSNRISQISTTDSGSTASVFISSDLFNCPNGLTLGPDGNLYSANFSDGRVNRVSLPEGDVSTLATLPGGGNGHITTANGRLYVVSYVGNQIFEVTLDGSFRFIAGSGVAGYADGPAEDASFFYPNGISASVTGDTLYVNSTAVVNQEGDLHPNVLRMITGIHSTLTPTDR